MSSAATPPDGPLGERRRRSTPTSAGSVWIRNGFEGAGERGLTGVREQILANSHHLFLRPVRLYCRRHHVTVASPAEVFDITVITTGRYDGLPKGNPETGYYASVIYHDGTQFRTAVQGPIAATIGKALEGLLDLTAVHLEGKNMREERFFSFPSSADLWRGEGRCMVDMDLFH